MCSSDLVLYPAILLFCSIGVYTINNTNFDVMQTAAFGLLGVLFFKLECEPAPLLLGFVLGKLMEEKLRQAMILSRGSFMTFVERPLSAALLVVALVMLILAVLPAIRQKRDVVFVED